MNCQQGDLAKVRILRPQNEDERIANGHIVVCTRFEPHPFTGEAGWIVSPPIRVSRGTIQGVLDSCLVPYRPGNEPDESLKWAPVPGQKETA